MSGSAVVMMIVAMVVIWGGLGLAVVNLSRYSGEEPGEAPRDL
ncbi:methionine/alanine import family NSS transporter small subunit [Actinotalea sp.]